MPEQLASPGALALGAAPALGVCSGFGISLYCFTRFILSRRLDHLLMTAAFCALSCGTVLQAAGDLMGLSSAVYDWITAAAWLFFGVTLAGATYATSVWRASSRPQAVAQLLISLISVAAFPLAALPYVFRTVMLDGLTSSSGRVLVACVAADLMTLAALALVMTALVGHYHRVQEQNSRLSVVICYYLVTCIVGLVLRSVSMLRFDELWWCSHFALSGSWLVLIGGFAVESAFAHREAADRLAELEAMHEVSWSLVGTGGATELLSTFANTLKDRLDARIVAVYIATADAQALDLASLAGPVECQERVGSRYTVFSNDRRPGFHTGHSAKAFTARETQVAHSVFIDVELVPWRIVAQEDGCAVSLPLVHQGEAIGVMSLYFQESGFLGPQRLRLLETIAAAVGPSIGNARSARASKDRQEAEGLDQAA